MARGALADNATRAKLPEWRTKPPAPTLLLQENGRKQSAAALLMQGKGHKREDDEDAQQSTLKLLEVEVSSLPQEPAHVPPALGHRGKVVPVLPPLPPPGPPAGEVVGFRRRGFQPLPSSPKLPPVLPAPSRHKEALDRLTVLVATARNDAEYLPLLVSYYRSDAPAYGNVLSHWLASQPGHPFFWSRLHHRVRWRFLGRNRRLSLLEHAEASIPPLKQTSRKLIYVKGWMAEMDHQESMQYRSRWLSVCSNRGSLARFFRLAANCALMAGYLEEIIAQPTPRDYLAEAQQELSRAAAAVQVVKPREVRPETQLKPSRANIEAIEAVKCLPSVHEATPLPQKRNVLAEAQEELLRACAALDLAYKRD